MEINLTKKYSFIQKAYPFVIVALLFILFKMSNKNYPIVDEIKKLKTKNELLENHKKIALKKVRLLEKNNINLCDIINDLKKQKQNIGIKIVNLTKEQKKKDKQISQFTIKEIISFYKERYRNLSSSILSNNDGIIFKDTVSKTNIIELSNFDSTKQELILTREVLKHTEKVTSFKDSIISNLNKQKVLLNNSIAYSDSISNNKEIEVDLVKKQLKKEKRNKIILGVIIAGSIVERFLHSK